MRDLADEIAVLDVAEMDVELPAPRRRITLRHVLPQDFNRGGAFHQHRAEIADKWGEYVLAPKSVGGADGA